MTDRAAEFLMKAAAGPIELPIRQLLAVWGFRARTYDSVGRIQRDLSAAGLRCEPDLAEGGLDSLVRVSVAATDDADTSGVPSDDAVAAASEDRAARGVGIGSEDEQLELPTVSLLVGDIPSATGGITAVDPSQTLEQAQALMIAKDYSQLAVIAGPRDLKGAVSWRTIARARLWKSEISLTDVIDLHPRVVHADEDLLGQIDIIYAADFVFVRGEDDRICGIITTADLTRRFRDLTSPFFQLGEIEGRLRRCINRVFTLEELRRATRQPKLRSAADMTLGQYLYLLKDETRWQRMHWVVDRVMFVGYLEGVRKIRNRVMHFGVQLDEQDKRQLVSFLHFMRSLDPLP
jgi:restriction system protein